MCSNEAFSMDLEAETLGARLFICGEASGKPSLKTSR
jgi:hypothetical protein